MQRFAVRRFRPLISNEPQHACESMPAFLENPWNEIDRSGANCMLRCPEELVDLGLIGVLNDHRV